MSVTTGEVLVLSAILFAIGSAGVIIRRNALTVLMCIELILNAGNIAFLAFARVHQSVDTHVFVIVVMTIAACEGAVGLAFIVNLFRLNQNVNLDELKLYHG